MFTFDSKRYKDILVVYKSEKSSSRNSIIQNVAKLFHDQLIQKKSRSAIHVFHILVLASFIIEKYSNDAAQQCRTESILWRLRQPLYGP